MDDSPEQYLLKWPHFLYVLVGAILFFVLMRLMLNRSAQTKRFFVLVSCFIMIFLKYAGEAVFIWEWHTIGAVSSYSHPFWDFRTLISFQLCGVNNVLLPLVIWLNIKPAKDFIYSTSIMGGLAVILYPSGMIYGDPLVFTFPMLRSLLVHFLLVFLPCFMIASGERVFNPKRWYRLLVGAVLMTIWAMIGNLWIDPSANNMFLMVNPFFGGPIPLLNQLPNGVHIIPLLLLVIIGFIIIYAVAGRYYRKKNPLEFESTP
jgi:hypothetical protein